MVFTVVVHLLVLVNVFALHSMSEIILTSFYCSFDSLSSWKGGENRAIACLHLLVEICLCPVCRYTIFSTTIVVCLRIVVLEASCILGYRGPVQGPEGIHVILIYLKSLLNLLIWTLVVECR